MTDSSAARAAPGDVQVATSNPNAPDEARAKLADELVTRAQQTAAELEARAKAG